MCNNCNFCGGRVGLLSFLGTALTRNGGCGCNGGCNNGCGCNSGCNGGYAAASVYGGSCGCVSCGCGTSPYAGWDGCGWVTAQNTQPCSCGCNNSCGCNG